MTETTPSPQPAVSPKQRHWIHAVTGLFEIVLVMGASLAVATLVQQNLSPDLMETLGVATGQAPDFMAASEVMGIQIAAQYGALLGLVALVGYLRGRRRLTDYAIAPPRHHKHPMAYGVAAGLIAGIVPSLVFILQDLAPIGSNTPFWEVQANVDWDWPFWLFTGIASYGVIAIVEEMAWRGYVQGRLMEGFAPGAAILITTLVFALLHVQYLQADAALQLTFAGLIFGSLIFSVSTYRTGSLVPAIIAHAIINTPMSTLIHMLTLVLALAVLIVWRKQVWAEARLWGQTFLRWSTLAALPALVLIAGLAIAAMRLPNGLIIIPAFVALGVVGLGFWKRSAYAPAGE